jgi:hypothetical protein
VSHTILVISGVLLYNSIYVVFGGVFYQVMGFRSHINNLCNASSVVSTLICLLHYKLERFVVSRHGYEVLLNPYFIVFDWYFKSLRNLLLVVCGVCAFITLVFCLMEVHQ